MEQLLNPDAGERRETVIPLHALEKRHTEDDILEGCPRTLKIAGIPVTSRAWRNDEFSKFGMLITHLGFSTCETEQDVATISPDDIFTTCAVNIVEAWQTGLFGTMTLEEWLYGLMKFPEGQPIPSQDKVEYREFLAFFCIILEQNNILKIARQVAKKKIRLAIQTDGKATPTPPPTG